MVIIISPVHDFMVEIFMYKTSFILGRAQWNQLELHFSSKIVNQKWKHIPVFIINIITNEF